jgi:protein-disulfide isomerase
MALVTGGAILAGVVVVAVLVFIGSKPPSSGNGGIATPDFASPAPSLEHDRSLGDSAAPVHVDLWADFQCPVCHRFTVELEPQLVSTYVATGKAWLTYHDLAFIGQESVDAAAAARISLVIGPGFWPMHDLLFANQGEENSGAFSRDRLASMAVLLGMDRAAFLSALNDPKYGAATTLETEEGGRAGIAQTPTLVINGVQIVGLPTWQTLSAAMDAALAASPAPSAGTLPVASPSGP